MEIKLGAFNLEHWHAPDVSWRENAERRGLTPGIRVCSSSNRKYLAVIIAVGECEREVRRYKLPAVKVVNQVQIFWMTGPRKGQQQWKDLSSLVNYDAYKERVMKEIKELEENEAEAAKTGL